MNFRIFILRVLLSTALAFVVTPNAFAQKSELNKKSDTQQGREFQLRSDDVTALVAKYGVLSGKDLTTVANPVRGFYSPQDKVTWTVFAPKEDDYVVSVLFSMRDQVNIEVSSGNSVLTAPSMLCT